MEIVSTQSSMSIDNIRLSWGW